MDGSDTREVKARRVSLPLIEVGFKDRRIAALAATHEFGLEAADGRVKLPERPAFRNSLPEVQKAMRDELLRIAKARVHSLGTRMQIGSGSLKWGVTRSDVATRRATTANRCPNVRRHGSGAQRAKGSSSLAHEGRGWWLTSTHGLMAK